MIMNVLSQKIEEYLFLYDMTPLKSDSLSFSLE